MYSGRRHIRIQLWEWRQYVNHHEYLLPIRFINSLIILALRSMHPDY